MQMEVFQNDLDEFFRGRGGAAAFLIATSRYCGGSSSFRRMSNGILPVTSSESTATPRPLSTMAMIE